MTAKVDNQIVKSGLIFIKQVRHHLINNFLHHNRVKTAGFFFIYVCFKDNVNKQYGVVAKICGCFEFCAVNRTTSNFALDFRNNHKIYVI